MEILARETYQEMKRRHEKEYNDFVEGRIFFAFSNKQFDEGMERIGLKPTDTDKIYSIGAGGFILRSESKAHKEMANRFAREEKEAIANDKDGTGYIREMFEYEMNNHEYGYTGDISDTLDCLGLTIEEINNNEALLNGFKIARKAVIDWYNENN